MSYDNHPNPGKPQLRVVVFRPERIAAGCNRNAAAIRLPPRRTLDAGSHLK